MRQLPALRRIPQREKEMTAADYRRITYQLAVLRDLVGMYGGRTIDNIIVNLESQRKWYEQNIKDEDC